MEDVIAELIKAYGTITLPVGFLSMLIARAGYYKFDDNLRRCFIVLVFAAVNYYCYSGLSWLCEISGCSQSDLLVFVQWLLACIITLGISFAWRKRLSCYYFKKINAWGISNENERGSVLNTIIQDNSIHINGLKIYTRDGKCYSCSSFTWVRENIYKEAQFLIDDTGVLMPVTDISYPADTAFKDVSGIGDLIIQDVGISHTYIPSSEIIAYDFVITNK